MKKGKYSALIKYLASCPETVCSLTFDEMEGILGFALPEVATKHASQFWSNGNQHYALIWLQAGRIVTQYSVSQRFAVFARNEAEAKKYLEKCPTRPGHQTPASNRRPALKLDAVSSNIECSELITCAARYFDDLKRDTHARYLSWEHCYGFFQKNRVAPSEQTLDLLCLQLAWYLASWGMLRGKAFLLQKDYLVHMPTVKLLTSQRYRNLYGLTAQTMADDAVIGKICELAGEITKIYARETSVDGQEEGKIASDTLVTKILLGTIGCTPAYDRYFKKGLSASGVAQQSFGVKSMLRLSNFYEANLGELEAFRKNISRGRIEYTPMKVMDMCLWQLGYDIDTAGKS